MKCEKTINLTPQNIEQALIKFLLSILPDEARCKWDDKLTQILVLAKGLTK